MVQRCPSELPVPQQTAQTPEPSQRGQLDSATAQPASKIKQSRATAVYRIGSRTGPREESF